MRLIVKVVAILMALALTGCAVGGPAAPTSTPTPTPAPASPASPRATATPLPPPVATATPEALPGSAGQSPVATGVASTVKAEPADTAVKLDWAAVSGAQGYLIYRDAYTESLNVAPVAGTTYEDIGLTNGKTYSYTVAAVDAAGKVIWTSGEVTATAGGT